MALRHADSFDWLTASQLTRVYSTVDDGSGSILVGPYGRGSGDAVRFSGDAAAYIRRSALTTSGSVCIVEADVRISAAPGSATALFRVLVGTTVQASLAIETDRKLKAYRGDMATGLGSSSTYVIPVNTWVRIGLKLTINDSTGAVLVHVWAPGDTAPQVALTLTSQDTKAHASSALWDAVDVSAGCAGTTDVTGLVVTDGSGSVNADLVSAKPRTVIARRPDAIGALSEFTPSSGLVNFLLVDDVTPDDVASFVSTLAADKIDVYHVTDAPDASQTIHGVISALMARHDVTTATLAHVIRQGATNTVGSSVALSTSYAADLKPYDVDPASAAFTPASFTALQFGAKSLTVDASVRLYLSDTAAGFTPTNYRGAWDDTGDAITKKFLPSKSEAAGNPLTVTGNHDTAATDRDILIYRGVSDPIAAQTVSGNFRGVLNCLGGSFADHDMKHHVHVYVTVGDSDTVRGTLLTDYCDTADWPVPAGQGGWEIPQQSLSSVAAQSGDRIVIEFGARTSQGAVPTFDYFGQLRYKACSDKPDAVHNDQVSTSISWVEFVSGLAFA